LSKGKPELSKYIRYFFIFFVVLYSFFVIPAHINAAEDFIVDYNVQYAVSGLGLTTVEQNISLLNRKTNLYAKEYSIVIDSTRIKNVTAKDGKGAIIPDTQIKDGKTQIHLTFNDQVVGQGKILHFTLSYQDDNIAKRNGSIWEITIPGVAEDQELGDYTVHLAVPAEFGKPAYVVQEPTGEFNWSKDQLVNGGVNVAFGSSQTFELTLAYYIENTKSKGVTTEIALPPSSAFQRVILESITPEPDTIVSDTDGNWLARYKLPPNSSQQIQATLITQLFLTPQASYPLLPDELNEYLKPTDFWNTQDPSIKELASTLKTPKAIYDYVVNALSYDYSRVNQNISRKGAVAALKTPNNSVCMEFTDVYIALARAAGIPAREAVGFAYTTNPKLRPLSLVSDVLHAWPEYYDSSRSLWVPIDPTWASTTGGVNYFTKLDFNHITFAFNGLQDTYPYPAGFYRQEGREGKDVDVRFYSNPVPTEIANITTQLELPKNIPAGIQLPGEAIIKNTARVAAENISVTIDSQALGVHSVLYPETIPPYGTLSVPLSLKTSTYFTFGRGNVRAIVDGKVIEQSVNIVPAYQIIAPVLIVAVWVIITVLFLYRKIRIWKPFRKQ